MGLISYVLGTVMQRGVFYILEVLNEGYLGI